MEKPAKKQLIFGTGLSSSKDYESLLACCNAAIESGIICFDTAPSYRSEEMLGRVLAQVVKEKQLERYQVYVQTKIDPIQMYEDKVEAHVDKTLEAMGLDYFDTLLIHWPVYKYVRRTWEAMKRVKQHGKVRNLGICNLRIEHLRELKEIGIIPEVLQIERHPLNIFETERQFCYDNDICLQDYSPLCKMHPKLKESDQFKAIAENHHCGIGEVILKWHIQTGASPIFTSTKVSRIKNYAQLNDIELSSEELKEIASHNINYKLYLESLICPGF